MRCTKINRNLSTKWTQIPGYEKWMRQRDSIPDELHEEDRKRKEEEERRWVVRQKG